MAESDKIVVAVRVRPLNSRERSITKGMRRPMVVNMEGKRTDLYGDGQAKHSTIERSGNYKEDRSFTFDFSFWSCNPADKHMADQKMVYDSLGVGLLDNAFKGYNACIFAYGQTGSGKTYTMMGTENDMGLIPRICSEMFTRVAQNNDKNVTYKVECSYLEIYNERVRDLLSMSDRKVSLKVREHKILGPYVEGLRTFACEDYSAIQTLIFEGTESRVTASTAMNDQSSRSHAVFNVVLTESTFDEMSGNTGEKQSRICLVDLAGSERVWRTGAEGDRLREGGSINKSLSTLGLVISHLADIAVGKKTKDTFIPYRDSILTWLLKENLGGNSKTVMVATVSPSHDSYEESLSTLRYADTAKRIQTFAVVNEDANARLIRDLREEVNRLRTMLSTSGLDGMSVVSDNQMYELKDKLAESERLMKEMSMSWEERLRIAHQVLEERAKQLKEMGISVQGGGILVDASKMYLLNLSPELSADELTMYYLKDTVTRIGSGKGQDVLIRGEGIQAEHCILPVEQGQLFVMPLPGASVHVNNKAVTGKTEITHQCALRFGKSKEFRVSCPMGRTDISVGSQPEPEAEEGLPSNISWPGSKFHRACEAGDMATVLYMLENPKDSNGNTISKDGLANSEEARWKRAPLMLAADHGHMDICKLLISHSADPGKADERGYTPLHACADSGHLEVCQLLVEKGGHPDPQAKIGCTPLHRAAEQGHLEVCKYLQLKGADVNFQDRGKGWTPLLLAALHGRLEVCHFLVDCRANVNACNRYAESCLHMAAQPGHVDIVKLLLQKGADATVQQVYGRTAFDYAAETTSFVMLHSPLDRLQKREEACRILFPHLSKKQQSQRSLTERKAIVIAQVPAVVEPGTFKCRMTNFASKTAAGGPARAASTRKSGTAPQNRMQAARQAATARSASARARSGTAPRTSSARTQPAPSARSSASGPSGGGKSRAPNLATANRGRNRSGSSA